MTAAVAPKFWLSPFVVNQQTKNRHTTPPQTHIAFIMLRPKGIGSRHKSGTGNNHGRKRTTPRDNQCFNRKDSHSNINELSSPVIHVPPPLNNSVINLHHLPSVCQQSYKSSQNTPRDNHCFNSKYSNSNINQLSSPLIPLPPPLNDSVINLHQLSSFFQQSSSSSQNTTPELQAYSIPGCTSPDPANTIPPPSTKNGGLNIYGFMVDVSKLTLTQRQQHAVILLQHYHEHYPLH